MNSAEIKNIIKKNPRLASKEAKLEAMKDGAFCMHNSWGFGKIVSYDEASGKLKIDFEGKPGHMMDPAFCVDKLEILDDNNILVRYRTDLANLQKEMEKGGDFVYNYIENNKIDRSASAIELENTFKQLFGFRPSNAGNEDEKKFAESNKKAEREFRKWWNKTKEELVRNPLVECPKTKNDYYVLRDEALSPEAEILHEYFINREPRKKILLAEKLFETAIGIKKHLSGEAAAENETSGGNDEIKAQLEQIKQDLTESVKKSSKQLNDADRLRGIWIRNDLIRYIEEKNRTGQKDVELEESKLEEIEPRSKDIIEEIIQNNPKDGLSNLAKNLPTNYLSRFLDLLARIQGVHWRDTTIALLKSSEGRFTRECVDFLLKWDTNKESKVVKGYIFEDDNQGKSSDLLKKNFETWLKEKTLNGPLILWVVKNRNENKYRDILVKLINENLLSALLSAVDNEALLRETVVSTAKIPLAEALSEDQKLVAEMLKGSTLETARDLAKTLMLNQGFEELSKKSILSRIIKLYPKVQSLVKTTSTHERLFVSEWSLAKKRAELEKLVKVELPASKLAIEAARELGDLRENSEYKMARERDELLTAQRAQLEKEIRMAEVFDFNTTPADRVGIGSIVTLRNEKGEIHVCTILGAWDSDTSKKMYSYQTPLAQALMDKKSGDLVETNIDNHITRWTVENFKRFIDDPEGKAFIESHMSK